MAGGAVSLNMGTPFLVHRTFTIVGEGGGGSSPVPHITLILLSELFSKLGTVSVAGRDVSINEGVVPLTSGLVQVAGRTFLESPLTLSVTMVFVSLVSQLYVI